MKKTFRVISLILTLLVFAGCGQTAEIKADDKGDYILAVQMNDGVKAEVKEISDAILEAFKGKSAKDIVKYMDDSTQVAEEDITAIFMQLTEGATTDYTLSDSYYVNNMKVSDIAIRVKKTDDAKDYIMLTPSSSEMCVLFFSGEKGRVSNTMMVITARIDGKMKIVWMDCPDFSYDGKEAPEYYTLAKKAKEAKHDFSAYIYAQMMYSLRNPGQIYFYNETEEMGDYAHEISAWGDDKFPIELADGKYKVHLVTTALVESAVIPALIYEAEEETPGDMAELVKDAFIEKFPYFAEDFDKITVVSQEQDENQQNDVEKMVFNLK